VFSVMCCCRRINSLPLVSIKTTSSLCCSESCASPQHPVAVIISTLMDSSTSSHLYSKSQNPKILVTIMLTIYRRIVENGEKAAFQTYNDLVKCALCDNPFLLQVWHRLVYTRWKKVGELFLLPRHARWNG